MNTSFVNQKLAASITKTASAQTYYTIRFLVDREHVTDAFRAYAYFRWVDDVLDGEPGATHPLEPGNSSGRTDFIQRQQELLASCMGSARMQPTCAEEQLLLDLVPSDIVKNSGLLAYLNNMMAVMTFDTERRGRTIACSELSEYTHTLASAVTEAMHYFIGHRCYSPHDETRYLAVSAAHITHMLRDTFDDLQAGYYNIPREVLEGNHITPQEVTSEAYRAWVHTRVELAREYFRGGRDYLYRVDSPRCRTAGLAYTARFEWLLDTIEREQYYLRPQYNERKSLVTGVRMGWDVLSSFFNLRSLHLPPHEIPISEGSWKKT